MGKGSYPEAMNTLKCAKFSVWEKVVHLCVCVCERERGVPCWCLPFFCARSTAFIWFFKKCIIKGPCPKVRILSQVSYLVIWVYFLQTEAVYIIFLKQPFLIIFIIKSLNVWEIKMEHSVAFKKEVFKNSFGRAPGFYNILQVWPIFLRHE